MRRFNFLTLFIVVMLFLSFIVYIAPTTSAWWNTNYQNYRMITVSSTYIDNTLHDFPLLVVLDNNSGDYTFRGSNGEDIEFVSLDNVTHFTHEVESFDNSGNTYCWVNISERIPAGSDYQFLVYYNNPDDNTVNNTPTNVWNDYYAVYHLNNIAGGVCKDSTANNYDDVAVVGVTNDATSRIGSGATFDGSDHIQLTGGTFSIGTPMYFSVWHKTTNPSNKNMRIYECADNGSSDAVLFYIRDAPDDDLNFLIKNNAGTSYHPTGYQADTGTWRFGVGTYVPAAGNDMFIYENGTVDTSADKDPTGTLDDFDSWWISHHHGDPSPNPHADYMYTGDLDELQICEKARNTSWIKAEFHSQNRTTGFLTFHAEKTVPPANQNPTVSNPYPSDGATEVPINFVHFNITVNDLDGDNMNITWRTNCSPGFGAVGEWQTFNTTYGAGEPPVGVIAGTYYAYNTSFVNMSGTKYWWSVNVSDGNGGWTNNTYNFTTFALGPPLEGAGATAGWEMVSLPVNSTISKYNCYIRNQTNNYTWNQSVTNAIIVTFIYYWDGFGYASSTNFVAYTGYWMYWYDTGYDLWANGSVSGGTTNTYVIQNRREPLIPFSILFALLFFVVGATVYNVNKKKRRR